MIKFTIAAAVLLFSVLASSASAQTPVVKLAWFGPDTDLNYRLALKPWADAINSDEAATIKIEPYPNGALGKALAEQPQLVLDGVADIALVNPALVPGRFPGDQLFELPGLFSDTREAQAVYAKLMRDGKMPGYTDYHVVGAVMNFNTSVFSRKPLTNAGQLRGLKVRINGAIVGQTIRDLGGVPVLIPPDQVVEAMGRGTIDGATFAPAPALDFGVSRVTNYEYKLPLGTNSFALLMNKSKYDALPAGAKAVLDKYSMDWFNALHVKGTVEFNGEVASKLKADPKWTVSSPSKEDLEKMEPIFTKIRGDWAAKNPENAKLLLEVGNILAGYRGK